MKTRIKETLNDEQMVFIPQYKGWIFWKPFLKWSTDKSDVEYRIFIYSNFFENYIVAFSSLEFAKKFIDYKRGFVKNRKTIIHKYP